eukprot:768622-Pyramimonas_sp.AAC.1
MALGKRRLRPTLTLTVTPTVPLTGFTLCRAVVVALGKRRLRRTLTLTVTPTVPLTGYTLRRAVAVALGKRRRGEDPGDMPPLLDMERDVLWRVNHDEFNRRFRHMLCVELVNKKASTDIQQL